MTGSNMGALMFPFLRSVFCVLTGIAVVLALFGGPWAWGLAACFLFIALWMHYAIKKYEARCARYKQESRDWLNTTESALYAAKDSASEQLKNLPGLKGMALGTAFVFASKRFGKKINHRVLVVCPGPNGALVSPQKLTAFAWL
jgi:hypothetical protein